jgi:hypothetical protein
MAPRTAPNVLLLGLQALQDNIGSCPDKKRSWK